MILPKSKVTAESIVTKTVKTLCMFIIIIDLVRTLTGQGWDFFDLQAEYLRMEVPNDQWKMTGKVEFVLLCLICDSMTSRNG